MKRQVHETKWAKIQDLAFIELYWKYRTGRNLDNGKLYSSNNCNCSSMSARNCFHDHTPPKFVTLFSEYSVGVSIGQLLKNNVNELPSKNFALNQRELLKGQKIKMGFLRGAFLSMTVQATLFNFFTATFSVSLIHLLRKTYLITRYRLAYIFKTEPTPYI